MESVKCKKKLTKSKIILCLIYTIPITAVVFMVVMILTVMTDTFFERDYRDDIIYELKENEGQLIIKEWSWGLGSGAEIYYKKPGTKQVLLGKTSGGDDGFCPFAAGAYEIIESGNTIYIKWGFDRSGSKVKTWREDIFELPLLEYYGRNKG